MRSYVKPIICFLIAAIMGVLFIAFMTPPIRNDSKSYHSRGMILSEKNTGNILAYRFPNREPVYPVFLGICFKIFGHNDNAVRFVQVILSAFTSFLVYSLATQFYGKNIGFISGLLYSFCPSFAYYPTFFLTETLAVFLFVFAYWLAMKAISTENVFIIVCAGLCLTIASLTKYPFLFFGIFIVTLSFMFNGREFYLKKKLLLIILVIGLLPLICFIIWSYSYSDSEASDDYRLFKTIFISSSELTLTQREQTAKIVGLVSRNLGELIFPYVNFRDLWPYPKKKVAELYNKADEKYANLDRKSDRYFRIILDLYKEHPYRYALSRVSVLMRLNALQYPSRLNETDRWKDFYNRSNNKTVGFILADFLLKTLTNPVLWFICGLLVIKRLGMKVMPILLPVLYINIVYCPFEGAPRFAMPILPFYLIGGAAMMFYLLKKLEHKFVCFEKFVRYFGKKVNAF